ncbi:short-chain dehydrogenase [Stachybotrys elegans]|uniref:Short-chain dehydrogenase n=1 Tax=Stachybotrys elegans TaxID=80388 RepID=A0A8K0SKX0_9HYPO|nr:short-chain dehydrogenase [Stachybotrys elegans]
MAPSGTLIFIGANGSSGIPASEHLLKTYPQYTAVLTVRDATDADANTRTLRETISRYPKAKATIHQVDLSKLSSAHAFASNISSQIKAGELPPIKAIICSAYCWNLVSDPEFTEDGYEKTFQVSHLSHVAIVLRLLDCFAPDGGRVEMISSEAHYRRKQVLSPYITDVPVDMDRLIHPLPDPNKQGHGFIRYATVKLVNTVWAYALNRHLQKDPRFRNITAVAMNPGTIGDARVFQTNTPSNIQYVQRYLVQPLLPIISRLNLQVRTAKQVGADMIELAVSDKYAGDRCYFTQLNKDEPDPIVLDEAVQERLWLKSAEWCNITAENCALKLD